MKVLGHKIELLTGTAGLSPPLPLCAALAARYLRSWSGAWWLVAVAAGLGWLGFEQEEGVQIPAKS